MKVSFVLVGLGVLLLKVLDGKGQFYKPSELSIGVGDAISQELSQQIHQAVNTKTGEFETIQLAQYGKKLIILDFWASWCGPCLASLNKLDSIQRMLKDDRLVIIPVTYQSPNEALRAYAKYRWNMTSIVNDTLLARVFPHSGIPYMVWIMDNKVVAFPQPHYVTRENILSMLYGKAPEIPQAKKDIAVAEPLFFGHNQSYSGNLLQQSVLAHGDPNFQQKTLTVHKIGDSIVLNAVNMPLLEGLLYEAYKPLIAKKFSRYNGIVFRADSNKLKKLRQKRPLITEFNSIEVYRRNYEKWVKTFRYSYTLITTGGSERVAYELMRADLNAFIQRNFGLEAVIEFNPEPILVIKDKT